MDFIKKRYLPGKKTNSQILCFAWLPQDIWRSRSAWLRTYRLWKRRMPGIPGCVIQDSVSSIQMGKNMNTHQKLYG
jgi:hypothetical protein